MIIRAKVTAGVLATLLAASTPPSASAAAATQPEWIVESNKQAAALLEEFANTTQNKRLPLASMATTRTFSMPNHITCSGRKLISIPWLPPTSAHCPLQVTPA